MTDDLSTAPPEDNRSVEEILREHERLGRLIETRFKQETTILFTDICGYTHYMETMGDLKGRSMIQRHNDILFPLIQSRGGVVIKTIGDAVMARFVDPAEAVHAAMDIQKSLAAHNEEADPSDHIHVKIGVHTGKALVEETDVFGDAVNVAARVQAKAGKDIILVSKDLYERVDAGDDIVCRHYGRAELKGKLEPMELYRVVWREEDAVLPSLQDDCIAEPAALTPAPGGEHVFQIDVTREASQIKISAYERVSGQSTTVRQYEEIPAPMDRVQDRCNEIVETLNQVNRRGKVPSDVLTRLRTIGREFYSDLFPQDIRERLSKSAADHLVVSLDDRLVHIPWELLHDGRQFLCQRFNMGRLVQTRQTVKGTGRRRLEMPLKTLILADPAGGLPSARAEGAELYALLEKRKEVINAAIKSEGVSRHLLREALRYFDLVHFAGHSEYNSVDPAQSGWILEDGRFTAADIMDMVAAATLPAFVFSNACQSARTGEWAVDDHYQSEIFGMANAFLLAGVRHYLGTFWDVPDESSRQFAMAFYDCLLSRMSIGDAVRCARKKLIADYGEESIIWAGYVLYGDPLTRYVKPSAAYAEDDSTHAEPDHPVRSSTRNTAETYVEIADEEPKKKTSKGVWMAVAALLAVAVGVGVWLLSGTDPASFRQASLQSYNSGDFDGALTAAESLREADGDIRLSYLVRGNVLLRRGDLDAAETAYENAVAAQKGSDVEKAEALIGLGRIASIRNQPETALDFYDRAAAAAPSDPRGYLSQAMVLRDSGDIRKAAAVLVKARDAVPGNPLVAAISTDIRERLAMERDADKQARIEALVQDLLKRAEEPLRAVPWDGWTSRPLTLWVMEFDTQGHSLMEGEDVLLASALQERLLEHGRVQLVERAVLDKLMAELKLSTSRLTDRNTALTLGRLLAARLILTGKIIHSGPQTQVSARLIETETGRIVASVGESTAGSAQASLLADRLTAPLLEKAADVFQLRGKVTSAEGDGVELNIGRNVGVRKGQRFGPIGGEPVLTVASVMPETAVARMAEGAEPLPEGTRVEGIGNL
jgi:class 3 adenylate cyclase/CHAT domain-containing protein